MARSFEFLSDSSLQSQWLIEDCWIESWIRNSSTGKSRANPASRTPAVAGPARSFEGTWMHEQSSHTGYCNQAPHLHVSRSCAAEAGPGRHSRRATDGTGRGGRSEPARPPAGAARRRTPLRHGCARSMRVRECSLRHVHGTCFPAVWPVAGGRAAKRRAWQGLRAERSVRLESLQPLLQPFFTKRHLQTQFQLQIQVE